MMCREILRDSDAKRVESSEVGEMTVALAANPAATATARLRMAAATAEAATAPVSARLGRMAGEIGSPRPARPA